MNNKNKNHVESAPLTRREARNLERNTDQSPTVLNKNNKDDKSSPSNFSKNTRINWDTSHIATNKVKSLQSITPTNLTRLNTESSFTPERGLTVRAPKPMKLVAKDRSIKGAVGFVTLTGVALSVFMITTEDTANIQASMVSETSSAAPLSLTDDEKLDFDLRVSQAIAKASPVTPAPEMIVERTSLQNTSEAAQIEQENIKIEASELGAVVAPEEVTFIYDSDSLNKKVNEDLEEVTPVDVKTNSNENKTLDTAIVTPAPVAEEPRAVEPEPKPVPVPEPTPSIQPVPSPAPVPVVTNPQPAPSPVSEPEPAPIVIPVITPPPAPTLTPAPEPAPVVNVGANAVSTAAQFIGVTPYVFGGSSPSGFDCSGFVKYIYGLHGINLPHSVTGQAAAGTRVTDPQPGDLVVFSDYHIGIYAGNDQMIDAPTEGRMVEIGGLDAGDNYYFVRL